MVADEIRPPDGTTGDVSGLSSGSGGRAADGAPRVTSEGVRVVVADKYELQDLLSEDATGKLYEAINRDTKRGVLLKVFTPEISADRQSLDRIAGQVQALVASRCDHHVAILDMEMPRTPDDPAVLVLERARGETLALRLDRMGGRLSIPETCRLFVEVLEGLEAAHNGGVAPIGCGLKYVFLTQYAGRRDFVKIRGPILATAKPRGGVALDLLAGGRVFYQCLTGEVPGEEVGTSDEVEKAVAEKASSEGLEPEVVRQVAKICARCLTGGYATAAGMASDIERTGLTPIPQEGDVSFDATDAVAGEEQSARSVETTQPTLRAKFRPTAGGSVRAAAAGASRADSGPAAADLLEEDAPVAFSLKSVLMIAAVVGLAVGVGVTLLTQFFSKDERKPSAAVSPEAKTPRTDPRPAAPQKDRVLSFGIAYYYPDQKVKREMLDLGEYLRKRTGYRVKLKNLNHRQVAPMLEEGRLDLAIFTPYLYVQARKKYKKFKLLGTHLAQGKLTYQGYLVVPEKSPVRRVRQLKGKRVCFVARDSTSGYLYPAAVLKQKGIDPDRDFKKVIFSATHKQVAEDLKRGKCDVAAMAVDTYLDDVVRGARRLRVVAKTGRIPSDAYCASPHLPAEIVEKIKQALVAFDPKKDLNRPYLGERHRITGFVLVGERHYDSLREVWQYITPIRPEKKKKKRSR